jgi:hypothetical protein
VSTPIWERLRAPDHRSLVIRPIRHVRVARLRIVDGDLPDHDAATVFDGWTEARQVVVRAAAQRDIELAPWEITAEQIEIEGSDGRLEALLAGSGPVAAPGNLERQACPCRGISTDAAYAAMGSGWATADAVKRATRIGFGPCQGRRCIPWLAGRLELPLEDPRAQITPRPPLVPVPLSLLAAYAEDQDAG